MSGFLSLTVMFPRFIHVGACQFFQVYCRIILRYVDTPCFVSPLTVHGHWGCFHVLAPVNNAVYTWCTHFCVDTFFQFFWVSVYLGVGLRDHMVILHLILEELPHCSPPWSHRLTCPPVSTWLQFLHLFTNTCHFLSLYSFTTHCVEYPLGSRPVLGAKTKTQAALAGSGDADRQQWQLVMSGVKDG